MVGVLSGGRIELKQAARFENEPVDLPDGLHWDLVHLYSSALAGLRAAAADELESVGIDSWGVDYGLLRSGSLLGLPFHYRDARTARGVESVHDRVPFADLYARNGLQFQPFNTLYQLSVEAELGPGDRALLIPDLLAFWLTGEQAAEATNASTTGLLDPANRAWDLDLLRRLELPEGVFAPLVQPGTVLGGLRQPVAATLGRTLPVVAVATHDTASAVAAVPMDPAAAVYISCGTWGLVGVELPAPIISEAGREANFTNEGGIDGTTRFLKNVMGLWVLTETLRDWERGSDKPNLQALLEAASQERSPEALIDVNDPVFLAPGAMASRVEEWLRTRGQQVPASQAAFVRLIVESIAAAFALAVEQAARLSGVPVRQIHLVGGGSLNSLLCQLTADRSGLPVLAGPVEATALGNALVQARALGVVGSLEEMRSLVAASVTPVVYRPGSLT